MMRTEAEIEAEPLEPHGPAASSLQVDTARAIVTWIVRSGLPAGFHLTEQRLCNAFGLSRSPIRGALSLLANHGIVERRPERGYYLKVSADDLATSEPVLPVSGNDELYRVMANAWFNGIIPDLVSTAELRRRFGGGPDVSRALERLAEDGVIVRSAGKGWRLGPNLASEQAFRDSYVFRLTIEPAAILLDTFRLDQPLAVRSARRHEQILTGGREASIKEMVDADLEFHHLIAVSCGNQFFAQAILRQNVLRRLTEMLTTPDGERLRASSTEHVGILDALGADRRELAATLMREHLTISKTFSPDFLALAEGEQHGSLERP
jgi:DNA-binding GntR family transcriptional regulator